MNFRARINSVIHRVHRLFHRETGRSSYFVPEVASLNDITGQRGELVDQIDHPVNDTYSSSESLVGSIEGLSDSETLNYFEVTEEIIDPTQRAFEWLPFVHNGQLGELQVATPEYIEYLEGRLRELIALRNWVIRNPVPQSFDELFPQEATLLDFLLDELPRLINLRLIVENPERLEVLSYSLND